MTEFGAIQRATTGPLSSFRRAPSLAGGFAVPEQSRAAPSPGPDEVVQPAVLTGLLALQEADTRPIRDAAAWRRAKELLDALAALQRALLSGGAEAALHDLAALTEDRQAAFDPGLNAVLTAIRLRALVELSRRHG